MDGYFEMDCDRGGDQLLFSYVGFKQQEMRATPGANLLVTLEEDSQALEEVVVVGYGMRSRSSLTGVVAGLIFCCCNRTFGETGRARSESERRSG